MRAALVLLALAFLAILPAAQGEPFDRGVEAYRRGDYGEAELLWRECLKDELSEADRARVAFDLGNARWRQDDALGAVGWYTLSIKIEPRRTEAWRNLELARAEAQLKPADRGDLRSTVRRVVTSISPAESRWLLLFALLPLALALGLEAFYGGKPLRLLSLGATLLALLAAVPWVSGFFSGDRDPMLIVRSTPVALRSEPRSELAAIGQVEPGGEVERIDALPGWVRVESPDGTRGWLQEDAVFGLRP